MLRTYWAKYPGKSAVRFLLRLILYDNLLTVVTAQSHKFGIVLESTVRIPVRLMLYDN